MRYYFELLRHFMLSHSRHGTHSPFVYKLTQEVIYTRNFVMDGRDLHIKIPFQDQPHYFSLLKSILVYMGIHELSNKSDNGAFFGELDKCSVEELLSHISKGQVVVVHEPYRNKAGWKALIASSSVVVSVDLFHFGLVMHREAQRKENFRLRYPYWI